MLDVSGRLGRFGEKNLDTLCSKCSFFQLARQIRRKNARKRCRIEPQRPLHFYKCSDFQQARTWLSHNRTERTLSQSSEENLRRHSWHCWIHADFCRQWNWTWTQLSMSPGGSAISVRVWMIKCQQGQRTGPYGESVMRTSAYSFFITSARVLIEDSSIYVYLERKLLEVVRRKIQG